MKISLLLMIVSIFFVAPQLSIAQQMDKDQVCNLLMPRLLEFVASISVIPTSLDSAMQTSFTPQARQQFADVSAVGHELGEVAIRFRQEFLTACYGNQ